MSESETPQSDVKTERLSQVLTTIIMKALVAAALWWFFFGGKSPTLNLSGKIMAFLVAYMICSLYVVALALTRNYLVAVGGTILLLLGVGWATDKFNAMLGSSPVVLDILVYTVFLFPIGFDIFRLYRTIKA